MLEKNYHEDIDAIFSKLYLSLPQTFSPDDWKAVSEASFDALDTDIDTTRNGKVMTMFIPTPTKEHTYSIYNQVKGNPFKVIDAMKFLSGCVGKETVKGLLALNLTGEGRDIMVLFPNARGENVDVYIIEASQFEENEAVENTKSEIKDIFGKIMVK